MIKKYTDKIIKLKENISDKFIKKNSTDKTYFGSVVDLKESYRTDKQSAYDGVPTVYYEIYKHGENVRVGSIELRLSIENDAYYYGHVGYTVIKQYRGNNYAYYACRVLFEIAKKEFKMNELYITCSPNNAPSYRTLQRLDGELIEQLNVPSDHMLYKLGETIKLVFKYNLNIARNDKALNEHEAYL